MATNGMAALNRRNYNNVNWVRHYSDTTLRPAEVMIFVNYRDEFLGRRVLDLGCGAGRLTRYLGRWTQFATGLDYSAPMVEYCRQAYPHITFVQCDARDLGPLGEGVFDTAVFSYNGIDTLDHAGRIAALSGIRRLLSPHGLLAFSSHNRRYRLAGQGPRLQFSPNPATMARRLATFARSTRNRMANRNLERHEASYAVLNDSAHDYSLLHYYIDRDTQKAQLVEAGFSLLECYGEDGEALGPHDDDSASAELHYVARRA
jgi:SAM-dependent methyltransferase